MFRIIVKQNKQKELIDTYKITRQALWKACTFRTNGVKSRRARSHAVNKLNAIIL